MRVPAKNVVHEINAGWTVAKALLGHERSMIAGIFGTASGRPRDEGTGPARADRGVPSG